MTATAAGSADTRRVGASERLALAAILVMAVALRLHGLATFPLDNDELATVYEGTLLFHAPTEPPVAARPVYYLLVHPLLVTLPHTPILLRLVPLVFGVAGVAVIWWLARRTLGRTAGIAAALLTAISPWHLYASGMERYWSLIFLLAAAAYTLLPLAQDREDRRWYLATLAVFLLGTATHPSFVFAVTGAVIGAHLIRRDGTFGVRWPSRTAWIWLWGPYSAIVAAAVVALQSAQGDALRNHVGRGTAANLRLVPAIVEWATPVMWAAAAGGVLLLIRDQDRDRRRWALMAGMGSAVCVVALVTAAAWTNVYADYAMAALPLVFVTSAALPQLAADGSGEASGSRRRTAGLLATVLTAVLAMSVLPATVSHLSDGTRFDYRPAFRRIEAAGPNELVVTWPEEVHRYYAPKLRTEPLTSDTAALNETLGHEGAIWVVASRKRYGLVGDDTGSLAAWLAARCRLEQTTERLRLDDREYAVALYQCGRR